MIYFDSAATTLQKPASVAAAVTRAVRTLSSPGRGGYRSAMEAAETAYRCRELAAELFEVSQPERVLFCMNATHALNIAIKSAVNPGESVVISGYEHNAVTRPLHGLGAEIKVAAGRLFDSESVLAEYERLLTREVGFAVINYVSNVYGFIQPVAEVAELCRKRNIPLLVDASQAAGILPVQTESWGASFVAMPGHKGLYGPQGTGLLLCGSRVRPESVKPLLEGGSGSESRLQSMPDYFPERIEAGTHNMPGIAGLRAGLEFIRHMGTKNICRHEQQLMQEAVRGLKRIGAWSVLAAEEPAVQSGVVSVLHRRLNVFEAAECLAKQGFSMRAGLHCAPLAHKSGKTEESGTLRMSFSAFNRLGEVKALLKAMEKM